MNVGLIGCGLIGKKRAAAVITAEDSLVCVYDSNYETAERFAENFSTLYALDINRILDNKSIDVVIVSTPNKFIVPYSMKSLFFGKHVLCEKPPGKDSIETEKLRNVVEHTGKILKVGFNHRYHPAISQAHTLVESGQIGNPMFIRAVYGHGGRLGYEKEWRADKELSGGGELLDQGVHLIDLSRWFMGDFERVFSITKDYYWELNGLEDNAFSILMTQNDRVAQFQTSWTQWKNRFNFEIYGDKGYIKIDGLGGSYGLETLTQGLKTNGVPQEIVQEFPGVDKSWDKEWEDFKSAIKNNKQPKMGNIYDGLAVMKTVGALYHSAKSGTVTKI